MRQHPRGRCELDNRPDGRNRRGGARRRDGDPLAAHLADRFSAVVTRGDRIQAVGRMETGPAGDTHLEVQTVTNLRTNDSRENDALPPGPGPRRRPLPPPPGLTRGNAPTATASQTAQGKVQRMTSAPMGEIDGAVLDDGTVIHWPPHLADRFSAIIARGDRVKVSGWMETGPAGDTHFEVLTATNLRTNASASNDVAGPPSRSPGRVAPDDSGDFAATPNQPGDDRAAAEGSGGPDRPVARGNPKDSGTSYRGMSMRPDRPSAFRLGRVIVAYSHRLVAS